MPVNRGVGGGVIPSTPDVAVERIRAGAKEAVHRAAKCKVPMPERFDSEIRFREHRTAYSKSFLPRGAAGRWKECVLLHRRLV